MSLPRVEVFADESCLGNGREGENPGGAAGMIEYHPASGGVQLFDFWISEPATTNNRMAIRSLIETFKILSRKDKRLHVRFTSDSQYLIKGMREWLTNWKRRGWRTAAGEPVKNVELWKEADQVVQAHEVEWRWVRGHNEHPQNEYADHLATRAAREQTQSAGAVPSLYGEWLAGMRAKGKMAASER